MGLYLTEKEMTRALNSIKGVGLNEKLDINFRMGYVTGSLDNLISLMSKAYEDKEEDE